MGSQDPYVKLKLGDNGKEWRSNIHNGGGKKPYWNQTFTKPYNNEERLHLTVWDSDTRKDEVNSKGVYAQL